MTPLECSQATGDQTNSLGGRFMLDPATFAKVGALDDATLQTMTAGKEPLGEGTPMLEGLASYVVGRFGVLGDVHRDIVVGAGAFINPDVLGSAWDQWRRHVNPMAVSELYYAGCAADWGRANFADTPELARLCELAERVVAAADPVGAPLFAGWRAMPRVADAPGAAMQLLNILRELRFSRHVVAVAASGMTCYEVLITKNTPGNAQMFGWPEPYPDMSHRQDELAAIGAHTDQLNARDFAVLSDGERQEFAEILSDLKEKTA